MIFHLNFNDFFSRDDGLESPMLHFKKICPPVLKTMIFEGFLPYMGIAAILVM